MLGTKTALPLQLPCFGSWETRVDMMAEPCFMSDTAMSMVKAEWVCTNFRPHGECSELRPLCWLQPYRFLWSRTLLVFKSLFVCWDFDRGALCFEICECWKRGFTIKRNYPEALSVSRLSLSVCVTLPCSTACMTDVFGGDPAASEIKRQTCSRHEFQTYLKTRIVNNEQLLSADNTVILLMWRDQLKKKVHAHNW